LIRFFSAIFALLIISGCSGGHMDRLYWQGELITEVNTVSYIYWQDGVQLISHLQDSVLVTMAGLVDEEYVFILVSLANKTQRPITFYPYQVEVTTRRNGQSHTYRPIKNKDIDQSYFKTFASVLSGAGALTSTFLRIPVNRVMDPLLVTENKSDRVASSFEAEKALTRRLFASRHTLFPGTSYAGLIVYELENGCEESQPPLRVSFTINDSVFCASGFFENAEKLDCEDF
jgi:hypothetical protein